jgi:hypothetical protein
VLLDNLPQSPTPQVFIQYETQSHYRDFLKKGSGKRFQLDS